MSQKMIDVIAEALQKECHTQADQLLSKNPKLSAQDCANVFMYLKLAQIMVKLAEIKEMIRKQNSTNGL